MSWPEKARLIKSDPVTCARHFEYSVQCLLKFLKSQLQPIGDLIDYFLRVEFQHRGSPYIHMLVWIKNAPLLNTSSKEDIIDFIDRNITCERPEEKDGSNEEHNTLAELVKFQLHRHSHTCKKGNSRKCRFNIPLPPMKETQILEPIDPEDDTVDIMELRKSWQKIQDFLDGLDMGSRMTFGEFLQKLNVSEAQYILGIRSSLKQPTVFLRRTPWEIRVNAYNKHIILAWRANMGIQYVMDVYACAKYVASYITKSQRGISELLRKASEEARTGNQDIRQQLRMVSNKFLNSVELSAQEAVYICLQLPMKKSSRQVVFINTNLPEDRVFLLKPNHVLQTMRDDDEDIVASSLISRYENRTTSLESVTLAEFAAWYNTGKITQYTGNTSSQSDDCLPDEDVRDEENQEHEEDALTNEEHRPEEVQPSPDSCRENLPPKRKVSRLKSFVISMLT